MFPPTKGPVQVLMENRSELHLDSEGAERLLMRIGFLLHDCWLASGGGVQVILFLRDGAGDGSLVMRVLLRSVMVKKKLSQKGKL